MNNTSLISELLKLIAVDSADAEIIIKAAALIDLLSVKIRKLEKQHLPFDQLSVNELNKIRLYAVIDAINKCEMPANIENTAFADAFLAISKYAKEQWGDK